MTLVFRKFSHFKVLFPAVRFFKSDLYYITVRFCCKPGEYQNVRRKEQNHRGGKYYLRRHLFHHTMYFTAVEIKLK